MPILNFGIQGRALAITATVQSSDTAAALPAGILVEAVSGNTQPIKAVTITLEDNNIRWAIGVAPDQVNLGHILYVGQSLRLTGRSMCRAFQYISAAAATAGRLQITGEY